MTRAQQIIPAPNRSRPFDPVEWGFVKRSKEYYDSSEFTGMWEGPGDWFIAIDNDGDILIETVTQKGVFLGSFPPTASDGEVLLRLLGIIGGEK